MEDTDTHIQRWLRPEDECVVCLAAPATMQTFPCGHKVVCRKCLIKTIQVAVSQRCLPLRCVICRDRILTLHHTTQFQGSSFGVTVQQSSTPSSTLISSAQQCTRPVTSPVSPTSPTGLFSFITGSRHQNGSPRLLSPTATNVQGLNSLTLSTNTMDNSPKLNHLTQSTVEEEFLRYAPTDIEAFVNSHNDALNMHKRDKPNQHKAMCKHNRCHIVTSSKRSEVAAQSCMLSQSVKIHPAATDHPGSFMDSSEPDNAVLPLFGSCNLPQKSVGGSKFLAKFLPKKSKRKCSCFRHEN